MLKKNLKNMSEKQKYIGAFLEGYFSDKKVEFGMQYYSMLSNAIDIAENMWKQYKKQYKKQNICKSNKNIIFVQNL